jgi:hypothetical protein
MATQEHGMGGCQQKTQQVFMQSLVVGGIHYKRGSALPLVMHGFCVLRSVMGVAMAGYRITPVLVFWTGRALYWVEFTFETGFELPSSCVNLPCYASNLNRNILDFMRWHQIDLGAQELKLTSGHRISTTFNGQNHFNEIAGSKVLDEYYNSYLRQ